MSTAKLYLFAKNTDAPFVARGFEYQKMKTLETWLENYLNKVDEVIYCDYEDDVFQRNNQAKEAKFRQIKLYKSNFSFKSEEVQKAVAHFFMLHVNSDYHDWNKQFVFEASSGVVASRGDNEAKLLQDWVANQDNLTPGLLARCAVKVRQFVTTYIEEQAKKLAKSEDPVTITAALSVLKHLTGAEWKAFTQCIRWQFTQAATPEAAFLAAHSRVQELVSELPFDMPEVQQRALEGILWETVSFKIAGSQPADRALTLAELEHHILASGTEQQRWYLNIYEAWRGVEPTGKLLPGEVLEIINAANYCRWTASLADHAAFWLTWLRSYIDHRSTVPTLWRAAAYEYLFLRMRPTGPFTPPSGTMAGDEDYVRRYFQDFGELRSPSDLENAQSLLLMVTSAYRLRRTGFAKAEILGWLSQFGEALQQELDASPTPSTRCRLLECQITSQLFTIQAHTATAKLTDLKPLIADLLRSLPNAAHYNVTRFSKILEQYDKILIKAEQPAYRPLRKALDELSVQLQPYVQTRNGDRERAKVLVARAKELLQQNNPAGILEALHELQSAKDLWNNKETAGSFVVALGLIAQVYQALGLSMAAKYYALGAAWKCAQSDGGELLVQEPEALALVFQADFQQGAWLSAVQGFGLYLRMRYHFVPQTLDWAKEPVLRYAIASYSLMHFAAPPLAVSLVPVLQKQALDFPAEVREQLLEPSIAAYNKAVTPEELPTFVGRQLVDKPLSDGGAQRTIAFRALGSTWTLTFANTYRLTPVAEEFAAHLQIVLAEIALSTVDFHLPKGQVELQLIDGKKWIGPKRLPTNTRYAWEVALRYFDKPEPEQINRATTHVSAVVMTILGKMSLLSPAEFTEGFTSLFEESSLSTKSLFVNAYQRMFRYFMPHKEFASLRHSHFQPIDVLPTLTEEHAAMQWKSALSAKYDSAQAKRHIHNRFENTTRCIWLTLHRLQQSPGYDDWLRQLREADWPDWQITSAVANYIINAKARLLLAYRQFKSENEHLQAINATAESLWELNELESYRSFSLESFQSEGFREQLAHNALYVLHSYGLSENGETPHFDAIREFLRVRFNGQQPVADEANPLLHEQTVDLRIISEAIAKDWQSAVSLRFMPSPGQLQPALAVLTFAEGTQGHAGYELLLDFFHLEQTILVLSPIDGKLEAALVDEPSGTSVALGQRKCMADELEIFLAKQPADSPFVFAIGTERDQGRGLISTRSPYSPFTVRAYQYKKL